MVTLISGDRAAGKTRLAALLAEQYDREGNTVCVVDCYDGTKGRLFNFKEYHTSSNPFGPPVSLNLHTLKAAYKHLIIILSTVNVKEENIPAPDFIYRLTTTRTVGMYRGSKPFIYEKYSI